MTFLVLLLIASPFILWIIGAYASCDIRIPRSPRVGP
jgi:hypothetical protein